MNSTIGLLLTEFNIIHLPKNWIVDPGEKRVKVLTLTSDNKDPTTCKESKLQDGDILESIVLEGFTINVDAFF